MSSPRVRGLVTALVGVPIGLVFLWLALRDADFDAVWRSLQEAEAGAVGLAVGAFGCVYAFQSARWRRIASTPEMRLARFYEMTVSGVAVNNVLPGRIGDLLRARWLGLAARMPAGRAFGTVVLDRACDLVVLVALLVIGIAAVATSEWLVRLAAGGVLVVAAFGAVLLLARAYIGKRERGRHSRGLLRRLVRDAVEVLAEPLGRRRPVVWLGLSLGAWAAWAVAAQLIALSLDIELSVADALFVTAVLNLGSAIPSSPGYVGTYEWLGVASLGLIGVPHEAALAFTILLHASWYVPTTLAGGLALGVRGVRRLRRSRAERATRVKDAAASDPS
ncbi:MAG TPA: lysylphosphatidylglycerol synthase transmembrane domain-containing protein [Gaiellaceae bacterium]|nr:lysylphosphatidylglycerol synthase transmembrane domain-containing protein [Gaiellaceae bacterium]